MERPDEWLTFARECERDSELEQLRARLREVRRQNDVIRSAHASLAGAQHAREQEPSE